MNSLLQYQYFESPIGLIQVMESNEKIKAITFVESKRFVPGTSLVLDTCVSQLMEYFNGERSYFDIPFAQDGTEFQAKVWEILMTIPFGKTRSYLDIAKQLKNLGAIRAVGRANGQNKIAIIVPCHRVIGNDGSLTGYAGGLARKRFLLELESSNQQATLF